MGAAVKPMPRLPAVRVAVCPLTVGEIVKEISWGAAVGAGVAAAATRREVAAAATRGKVPGTITQGAAPQGTLATRMVAEQQSAAPLVPGMEPQPVPPHVPQASAQQMTPLACPTTPLGHVDGSTSVEKHFKGKREKIRQEKSL